MVNEECLSLLLQELVTEVYALRKIQNPLESKSIDAVKEEWLRRIRDTLFKENTKTASS